MIQVSAGAKYDPKLAPDFGKSQKSKGTQAGRKP